LSQRHADVGEHWQEFAGWPVSWEPQLSVSKRQYCGRVIERTLALSSVIREHYAARAERRRRGTALLVL
jgi:hypothetical protein